VGLEGAWICAGGRVACVVPELPRLPPSATLDPRMEAKSGLPPPAGARARPSAPASEPGRPGIPSGRAAVRGCEGPGEGVRAHPWAQEEAAAFT